MQNRYRVSSVAAGLLTLAAAIACSSSDSGNAGGKKPGGIDGGPGGAGAFGAGGSAGSGASGNGVGGANTGSGGVGAAGSGAGSGGVGAAGPGARDGSAGQLGDASLDASSGGSGVSDGASQSDGGFSVAALPGLVLWLDAAKGVTGTSPVTAWADQSGNGNNGSDGNGTLVASAINGLPAVHLVVGTMNIAYTPTLGFGTGEFLFEVVARATSIHGLFFGTVSTQLLAGTAGDYAQAALYPVSGTVTVNGTTPVIDDMPHLIGMQRSGSGVNAKLDVRINGAVDGTMSGGTFGDDLLATSPGMLGNADEDEHIAELVVIKGPTSANDLANLEAYLKTKYGL